MSSSSAPPVARPSILPRTLRARLLAVLVTLVSVVVLGLAAPSAANASPTCGALSSGAAPEAVAAVNHACEQIGTPYSWGGGHGTNPGPSYGICDPSNGAPNDCNVYGFDCSGLVRYAYYLAVNSDIVPGVTTEQWLNPHTVARFYASQGTSELYPGDLVFFGSSSSTVHHVAIYIGQGYIVEAPYSGGYVQEALLSSHSDYYGAIRLYAAATPPSKYWADTSPTASVFSAPDGVTATGTLYQGTSYVYCKSWGAMVGDSTTFNHWWLLTDPDVGPARQWVSAYYLTRWGNDVAEDNDGNVIPDCGS